MPKDKQTPPKQCYSVEEFAWAMGLGKRKAEELVYGGHVLTITVGRRRLVPVKVAEAYVDKLIQSQHTEMARLA